MTERRKYRRTRRDEPTGSVRVSVSNQFGDPESALQSSRFELADSSSNNGEYYEPPLPFSGLAKLLRVNPHHGTLPSFRAGLVAKYLKPNALISRPLLRRVVADQQAVGNGFFKFTRTTGGQVIGVDYQAMINTRRSLEQNRYGYIAADGKFIKFKAGEICHVMEHDPFQQIYGIPHWIGAVQSILLGEDARLFQRLYFRNAGNTGDFLTTSGLSSDDQKLFDEKIDGLKGKGKFKRVTIHLPKGDIDKIFKAIPHSVGTEKLDISKLASLSAGDILEGWRIRPELAGMMPENTGGSGDLSKIMEMDHLNEVIPLQQLFADTLNEHLPKQHWLAFYNYGEINKTASK